MDYYKNSKYIDQINQSIETIEKQLQTDFLEKQASIPKPSHFTHPISYKNKKAFNNLVFQNSMKEVELEKIKLEINSLKSFSIKSPKKSELIALLQESKDKNLMIEAENKQYQHLKIRAVQEKTESKKKLRELKESHEKFNKKYSKVLITKDIALNNYLSAKGILRNFRLFIDKEKCNYKEKVNAWESIKLNFKRENKKIIESIGIQSYKIKASRNKLSEIFSDATLKVQELNESSQKFQNIREVEKKINEEISSVKSILNAEFSNLNQIDTMMLLLREFQQKELEAQSLSFKFQELSSALLTKKIKCEMLRSELKILCEDRNESFDNKSSDFEQVTKHTDIQAENTLVSVYVKIINFTHELLTRIQCMNELLCENQASSNSFNSELKSEILNSRIYTKKSMVVKNKSKTLMRLNTITNNSLLVENGLHRKTLISSAENHSLLTLCEKYFKSEKDASKFLLNNRIISLFLRKTDILYCCETRVNKGKFDIVSNLYSISQNNLQLYLKKQFNKVDKELEMIRFQIPGDMKEIEIREIPQNLRRHSEKNQPKYKISLESPKNHLISYSKKNLRKKIKNKLEIASPISSIYSSLDALKEIKTITEKIDKIKLLEISASQSVREFFPINSKLKLKLPSICVVTSNREN